MSCSIPISIGELFDKYTILQIKSTKIKDQNKLNNINKEINYLQPFINKYNIDFRELKDINEKLWIIEDNIREKERDKIF